MYPKLLISVRKSIRLYERQDHTVEIFIFLNFSFTIPPKVSFALFSPISWTGNAEKSHFNRQKCSFHTNRHWYWGPRTNATYEAKTPGFEVTVWVFVPNLILLLNSFNFSVVNPLNFMVFMQVYRLRLPLFKLYFCELCMDNTVPYIVSVHCNLVKIIFIASLSYWKFLMYYGFNSSRFTAYFRSLF